MQQIDSVYGPGCVGVISADDLARYHHLLISLESLQVPKGSRYCHATSCNPARNTNNLIKMMLELPEMQWLWIMGDDHCFESDCLMRLLALEKDLALPLCVRRLYPYDPVVMKEFNPADGVHHWYTWDEIEAKGNTPFTCAAGGTAGLLVQRRVVEQMEPPYCQIGTWTRDDLQEDIFFTWRARQMGFKTWVDPTNPIGHITNAVMFPKWHEGRLGVAGNIGGHKMYVVPPGHTAKKNEDGDHVIERRLAPVAGGSW